jgi:hypothetical protein
MVFVVVTEAPHVPQGVPHVPQFHHTEVQDLSVHHPHPPPQYQVQADPHVPQVHAQDHPHPHQAAQFPDVCVNAVHKNNGVKA